MDLGDRQDSSSSVDANVVVAVQATERYWNDENAVTLWLGSHSELGKLNLVLSPRPMATSRIQSRTHLMAVFALR